MTEDYIKLISASLQPTTATRIAKYRLVAEQVYPININN